MHWAVSGWTVCSYICYALICLLYRIERARGIWIVGGSAAVIIGMIDGLIIINLSCLLITCMGTQNLFKIASSACIYKFMSMPPVTSPKTTFFLVDFFTFCTVAQLSFHFSTQAASYGMLHFNVYSHTSAVRRHVSTDVVMKCGSLLNLLAMFDWTLTSTVWNIQKSSWTKNFGVYGNACCGLLKELFEEAKSLELWEVTLQHKMYVILDSTKKYW